jgi:LDH2 family malate/lactate/ureidoglycolate dehydrogenase
MVQQLKSSPLAESFTQVYVPGEIEQSILLQRTKDGIPISVEIWADLEDLSQKYNIKLPNKK